MFLFVFSLVEPQIGIAQFLFLNFAKRVSEEVLVFSSFNIVWCQRISSFLKECSPNFISILQQVLVTSKNEERKVFCLITSSRSCSVASLKWFTSQIYLGNENITINDGIANIEVLVLLYIHLIRLKNTFILFISGLVFYLSF